MKIHDMIGVVILIIIMLIGASIIMILTMIIIIGSSIILLLIIISSSIVITMNIVDGRYIQLHVHMHHLCLCLRVWGGRGSGPIAATNNWAMLVRTMTPLSCPFLSCIVCSIPMLFRFNHALNGFAKKNTVPPCRQKKNQNGTSKWYIKIHCHPMFIIIVAIKMATHMAQQPPAVLPRCRRPSVTSRVFWIPPCHGHWYRSGNPFDRLLVYNNITKLTGWSGVYGGYI